MSLQRPLLTSSSVLIKLATNYMPRSCPHATRQFTSSMNIRSSSKRKLVTTTGYRTTTLDPSPPPRNSPIVESSIAGGIPQVNDIRPPAESQLQKELHTDTVKEKSQLSITEAEAQKSKSVEATQPTSTTQSTKAKRPKLRPRKAAMHLTQEAISHLRELLAQPDPKLIRVGVKNRGCSGLAYHLEYVDKPGAFDEAVEQDGVKVLIDSKALFSIIGSEMDWVEDKLNQRFVFRNPNISGFLSSFG